MPPSSWIVCWQAGQAGIRSRPAPRCFYSPALNGPSCACRSRSPSVWAAMVSVHLKDTVNASFCRWNARAEILTCRDDL